MKKRVKVEKMFDDCKAALRLRILAGKAGLKKEITTMDVNRPGLVFAGYTKYFAYSRVQILGRTEISYLKTLEPSKREKALQFLYSFKIPCVIVSRGQQIPEEILKFSDSLDIPLLLSPFQTSRLILFLVHYLEEVLSPQTTVHGSLVDVFGMGVLMLGESGAGKSECALELIERGHRLVADDVVEIKRMGTRLIGSRSKLIRHRMEIRGLGIIDIKDLFGASAVCEEKEIDLVVSLEEWTKGKEYDRLGLDSFTHTLLDIEVPKVSIPVGPGRSLAVIVEVASMNQRLKEMGYFSAQEFNKELLQWMEMERRGARK
jgi:HPr kinase/phosphorylase